MTSGLHNQKPHPWKQALKSHLFSMHYSISKCSVLFATRVADCVCILIIFSVASSPLPSFVSFLLIVNVNVLLLGAFPCFVMLTSPLWSASSPNRLDGVLWKSFFLLLLDRFTVWVITLIYSGGRLGSKEAQWNVTAEVRYPTAGSTEQIQDWRVIFQIN